MNSTALLGFKKILSAHIVKAQVVIVSVMQILQENASRVKVRATRYLNKRVFTLQMLFKRIISAAEKDCFFTTLALESKNLSALRDRLSSSNKTPSLKALRFIQSGHHLQLADCYSQGLLQLHWTSELKCAIEEWLFLLSYVETKDSHDTILVLAYGVLKVTFVASHKGFLCASLF